MKRGKHRFSYLPARTKPTLSVSARGGVFMSVVNEKIKQKTKTNKQKKKKAGGGGGCGGGGGYTLE